MVMTTPVTAEARERCGAKKRQGEGHCSQPAGWGTDHVGTGRCKLHGGKTWQQRRNAEATIVEQKAKVLFGEVVEETPVRNPLDVYAGFAGQVIGWMDTMAKLVQRLSTPGYSGLTGEQVRAEVQLFERAMDRCNTVLSTYAKLNIDERLSRITAEQQQMVVEAIEAALAAANVTGALALEAKRVAARKLRTVA